MSQYLEFFIRHGETYLPIASFCGSSAHMEAFDYEVPSYSGLAVVSKDLLGIVQEKVNREITSHKKDVQDYEEMNKLVLSANNSMEEKMEEIRSNKEMIDEYNDRIKAWTSVDYFIGFLRNILDEVEYSEDNGIQKDKYLYVGIEPEIHKDMNEITDEEIKILSDLTVQRISFN